MTSIDTYFFMILFVSSLIVGWTIGWTIVWVKTKWLSDSILFGGWRKFTIQKCHLCNAEFKGRGYLVKYRVGDFRKVLEMTVCDECGSVFDKISQIRRGSDAPTV